MFVDSLLNMFNVPPIVCGGSVFVTCFLCLSLVYFLVL